MHHSTCELVNAHPLLSTEAKGVNGTLKEQHDKASDRYNLSKWVYDVLFKMLSYICSQQLVTVINAGYTDLPLADKRVVIRVGGNKQSLWKDHLETECIRMSVVKVIKFLLKCYLLARASCWTWSGRKYGSFSLQTAGTSLWIFPTNLTEHELIISKMSLQ